MPASSLNISSEQVRRGAETLRAPADLARIGLGVGHDLGHRFHRQVRVNRDDQRRLDQLADRRKHLDRIVADVGVHRRAGGQRSARRHQERVAIGIGGRDELAADAAAGAAAVFDHDGLAEHRAEPVGDDARHAVGRPARRERHDHLDRFPAGISLRVRKIGAVQRPTRRTAKAASKALIILASSPIGLVTHHSNPFFEL